MRVINNCPACREAITTTGHLLDEYEKLDYEVSVTWGLFNTQDDRAILDELATRLRERGITHTRNGEPLRHVSRPVAFI
jgi:hypothetical protein